MSSQDQMFEVEASLSVPNPKISCQKVSKCFYHFQKGDLWRSLVLGQAPKNSYDALKDISFVVEQGKFIGLLGHNGAGKSTLLRTVGGVYHPSSGVIQLSDQVSGIYELGVSKLELMTGREYAVRWLTLSAMEKDLMNEAIEDIKIFSELGDFFDRKIRSYSSGMKARLFFGVATANPSHIFLIDEVLAVGDIYFAAKCWRRLRQLISKGASGILATHDWASVLKLCDRALILENGRVKVIGEAKNVVQQYIDLPPLKPQLAHFKLAENGNVHAISGQDFHFSIPVTANTKADYFFALSIEQFVPGEGWEHVLLYDLQEVFKASGDFLVEVTIPNLPLSPGTYSLCFFLNCKQEEDNSKAMIACDARGWTTGNEICLIVEGDDDKGGYNLPLNWSLS